MAEPLDTLAQRFARLFSGLTRAYGKYDLSNVAPVEGGKRKGEATTVRADLLPDHYKAHLLGEKQEDAIGVIPIQDDNTVEFGAIDVDEYLAPQRSGETNEEFEERKADFERELYGRINSIIKDNNLPLNPCRSKSGGMHLFVFCERPMPASMVKRKLEDLAAEIGYPGSEVFPKQNNISADGVGNWINLPFFDHENTDRYGWDVVTSEPITSLSKWLDYAESRKLTPQHFNTIAVRNIPDTNAEERPITDGPPCLQKLLERGIPEGTRNIVSYNLGIYLHKKHGSDDPAINDAMTKLQQQYFDPPLSDLEMSQVLAQAARAEKKHFQCNQQPLSSQCNRSTCVRRSYGVGDIDFNYEFGTLWHVVPLTKTGRSLWEESSYRLQFTLDDEDHYFELTVEELLKYASVRTQALYRGVMIPHLDAEDWYNLMEEKLRNKVTEKVPEEITVIGELRALLEEFFEMYANATEKRTISNTKAWHNTDDEEYWVLPPTIPRFLIRRRFSTISGTRLHSVLQQHFGMQRVKRRYKEGGSGGVHMWIFPEHLAPDPSSHDDES